MAVALVVALGLGGCSGGSSDEESGPTTTVAGSTITTAGGGGALTSGEFCTLARSYAKAFERFGQPGTSTDLRAYYQTASADIVKAVEIAPADIKAEVQTVAGTLQVLVTSLESINYDFTRVASLPPDLIVKLMDRQFIDAATKVATYNRDKCGIS